MSIRERERGLDINIYDKKYTSLNVPTTVCAGVCVCVHIGKVGMQGLCIGLAIKWPCV